AVAGWNVGSGGLMILLNKGDGTFRPAVNIAAGAQPQSVAVGDFDGDGHLDLIAGDTSGVAASLLLGRGDGTFQSASTVAVGQSQSGVVAGDFDGDGKLDFAASNTAGTLSSAEVLLGNGDGTFKAGVKYSTGNTSTSIASADLNGDGKLDLITTNQVSN